MGACRDRPRSLLFLTATVVAALFAGLTAASGSRYLAWMDERARRLEIERDQQAVIAAAAERTRIARELHDIVSHSLSVVITLADAAAVVGRTDPGRGAEAMARYPRSAAAPVRHTGNARRATHRRAGRRWRRSPASAARRAGRAGPCDRAGGRPGRRRYAFPLGAAAELTVYRIVQEALTNTLRHGAARHAAVTIAYDSPGSGCRSPTTAGDAARRDARQPQGGAGARDRRDARTGGAARRDPPRRAGHGWSRGLLVGHPRAARVSISVLLADDQPLLRRGFRMILEAEGDLTWSGSR